jgi:hypothetical protein
MFSEMDIQSVQLQGKRVLLCTNFPVAPGTRDFAQAREVAGGALLAELAGECLRQGASFAVCNERGQWPDFDPDLIISEMGCGHAGILDRSPKARKVIYCLESPVQAKAFHLRLSRITAAYDVAYLFRGLLPFSRAKTSKCLNFPADPGSMRSILPDWNARSGIGYVGSPKSIYHWFYGGADRTASGLAKDLGFFLLKSVVPALAGRELYRKRFEFGCRMPGVTIYGRGWGEARPAGSPALLGGSPAGVLGKLEVLSRHRFALCLENYRFPGYITEKITDAIMAGAVPVYDGAPDIAEFLPADAFVDASDVEKGEDLARQLACIDETEWRFRAAAGRRWLAGLAGKKVFAAEIAAEMLGSVP